VIFITAHDAYAIKAFRFAAIDYLLKPLDADELLKAINRAQKQIGKSRSLETQLEVLKKHQNVSDIDKIVLNDADNIHLVPIEDILRCESSANYTLFHLRNKEKILVSRPLKEYDLLLSDKYFFRTHQSHLINLKHFSRYEKRDGGAAVLSNGDRVPVSTRKKDDLIQALKRS
jgi:two-component system LytT family response regulator